MIADEVRRFGLKMNMCIRDMGLRLSVDDRETETSILFSNLVDYEFSRSSGK